MQGFPFFTGVAQFEDDSCEVRVPPALKIKRTGGTPIPQNNQNHPAIMQRLFTYCTPANVSDDLSLIELLSHNLDYFRALAGQYPEDYYPAGQRVSPG